MADQLSNKEYIDLYDKQIASYEKAKMEAVSREDYELAAQLKTTVENLKQQRADLATNQGAGMAPDKEGSTLDKKAWAQGGFGASDVSPYKGMKESPECWPLPFHLDQVTNPPRSSAAPLYTVQP